MYMILMLCCLTFLLFFVVGNTYAFDLEFFGMLVVSFMAIGLSEKQQTSTSLFQITLKQIFIVCTLQSAISKIAEQNMKPL